MFSATITGKIKRVLFDNEKDGKDAMIKVVIESRKQYAKEDDMPNVYPVVAIFGHDAAYVRDYAGEGHWIHAYNCDYDAYRGDDDEQDRISFKAGRVEILPKAMAEAIADTIEEDDEPKKKKRGSKSKSSSRGKSRSERRKRRDEDEDDYDDEDDEEEEEKPRRKKKPASKKTSSKKSSTRGKSRKKPVEDDDFDDDYDDDDDDDDYFEDED